MAETKTAVKAKKKRKSLATLWREFRSDLKKITWPSFKSVVKNSVLVLVTMIIVSAIVSLLDLGLMELLKLVVG